MDSPNFSSGFSGRELFDFLLENTPDQVYFKDRDGRFTRASKATAIFMGGRTEADLIGKTDADFWSQETAAATALDEKRIMETGVPMIGKVERLILPGGKISWDYSTKLPLRNAAGQIVGICGINRDFTKLKQTEEALEQERNRLQLTTEELSARNAQLEADLRMARDIQLALLPRDYPHLEASGFSGHSTLGFAHCYRPAAAVGGDFFDIFPLTPQRAGVFICDVMGHGLRAALIVAIIRTLLEELRPVMHNAGRFLSALNLRLRAILDRVEEPFVATAFYLIVDTSNQEISFANAAHPGPVCLRRREGEVAPLIPSAGGPGLGLFDDVAFTSSRAFFGDQDCLLLFTDGLYEAEAADGTQFGMQELLASFRRHAALPPADLFDAVLRDVSRFTGKAEFEDDVCIVAVERTNSLHPPGAAS